MIQHFNFCKKQNNGKFDKFNIGNNNAKLIKKLGK